MKNLTTKNINNMMLFICMNQRTDARTAYIQACNCLSMCKKLAYDSAEQMWLSVYNQ